jgi:hypothetical protein
MLMRKKIFTAGLLLLLSVPVFFSISLFIAKEINAHLVKEQLEKQALQTITVPMAGLIWLKKGKEALINGKLFDVKTYAVSGSKLLLKGLYDETEDNICKQIKELEKHEKNTSAPFQSLLIKLLSPAELAYAEIETPVVFKNIDNPYFSFQVQKKTAPLVTVPTPPPNA